MLFSASLIILWIVFLAGVLIPPGFVFSFCSPISVFPDLFVTPSFPDSLMFFPDLCFSWSCSNKKNGNNRNNVKNDKQNGILNLFVTIRIARTPDRGPSLQTEVTSRNSKFWHFQFFGCLTSFNGSKSKTKDSVGHYFFISDPPVSSRSPYLSANDQL